MHVALGDEGEYDGGRLVFASRAGFEVPRRPAGSATIHTHAMVHGVTTLRSGTRYSLFLCDTVQSACCRRRRSTRRARAASGTTTRCS